MQRTVKKQTVEFKYFRLAVGDLAIGKKVFLKNESEKTIIRKLEKWCSDRSYKFIMITDVKISDVVELVSDEVFSVVASADKETVLKIEQLFNNSNATVTYGDKTVPLYNIKELVQ